MGTYLQDNRPSRSQFRCPRRERPSGVMCIHTAENAPDFVAFDGGAEAVANFIRTRSDPGSYHDLVDSDSGIQLVPYTCEAYQDGTGSNPHAWGGSVATRADVWPLAPKGWRDGAVNQLAAAAARYARWVKANYGITVPAKRISRAQSEQRVPGFISHAERDPARRSDPGRGFPWDQFLATYARLMGASPQPEEDDMFENDDRELLQEAVLALRANREPKSGHYGGRVLREIKDGQVKTAQKAVDDVMQLYAATDDSPLHKIIRDVLATEG